MSKWFPRTIFERAKRSGEICGFCSRKAGIFNSLTYDVVFSSRMESALRQQTAFDGIRELLAAFFEKEVAPTQDLKIESRAGAASPSQPPVPLDKESMSSGKAATGKRRNI